jgi:hypothetical protein
MVGIHTKTQSHKKEELSSLRSQMEYWNYGIMGYRESGMGYRAKSSMLKVEG